MDSPGPVRNAGRHQTPQVMTPPTMSQVGPFGFRRVPFHLRSGVHHGYPICCVIHFCWDNMLGRAAGMTRWKQICQDRTRSSYVPCGLLHAGGSTFALHERLWRMLGFEWALLQPNRQGRELRELASMGSPRYQTSTIEERQRVSNHGNPEGLWWSQEAT